MAKRFKSIVGALVLFGASIAFGLGAVEACLRLFPELMPEEAQLRLHWNRVNKPLTRGDPYLGHLFPPNYQGRFERDDGSFAFTYTTDEHGFRNRSPWPRQADVVVLGDSMAFGYGVEDDEAWTALLADQLPRTRVINLGLIGAAPQQYFRLYETFGQALQPNLVLFCPFPGNDVTDAGLFDRWVKAGSQGNYYYLRQFLANGGGANFGMGALLRQSYLVSLLYYARKGASSRLRGRTVDFPDGGQIQLVPSVRVKLEREAQADHANFRMVLDTVNQTRELARRNGSEFLVVLMPTKEEVYLPLLDQEPRPANSPFVDQFDAAGIPYLDLTPGFQAKARQGERLFFKVDGHPNAAGYRLIANLVLGYLRSHPQRYRLTVLD